MRARVTSRIGSSTVVVASLAVASFTAWGSRALSTDGWLSLAAGREIVRNGLPSHNHWTLIGYGRAWVDQQWLAQLSLYGMHRIGGLGLLVGVNVVLVAGTYVAAMVIATARGATSRSVATVAAVALLPYFATANPVRPQTLAYPLFLAVLAGTTTVRALDARRVAVLLALLVVWANLHGSVLLGAAIVAVRGVVALLHDRRRGVGWLAAVGAPAAVLCSPYAFGLIGYYRATAFSGAFGRFLAQWAPTRLGVVSAPIFVLVLGMVWLTGRTRATDRFGRGLLLASAFVALLAVRNWPWFALTAVFLLPAELDRVWRPGRTPARAARGAWVVAGPALCLAAAAVCVSSFSTALRRAYPAAAAGRAAAAVHARPGARVFATARLADWLLWEQPGLIGHLEADARYELLRPKELEDTVLFVYGSGVGRYARQDRVFVLDPRFDDRAIAALPNAHVVFRSTRVVVAVLPRI